MRKLPFLAVLLCTLVAAHAAAPLTTPAKQHPLTGSWTWTLPGKQCTETWHYRANGTGTASSGEASLQNRYEVSVIPSLLGFYRVTETITEANGKLDCSGDLQQAASEPVTRFLQFSPKRDQLIVCKEESLKACFGPLKRSKQ